MKSQLRIIGGQWRGSKISVTSATGLRPTPDRIRETLFNWLGLHCRDAIVLDCFAGSGVLGFEALSRGAKKLVAIETNTDAADSLKQLGSRLQAAQFEVIHSRAELVIAGLDGQFDLVFIDPPYALARLRTEVFKLLEASDCLRRGAIIYFEWPSGENFELPSPKLDWLKQKQAGQVNYGIAKWQSK